MEERETEQKVTPWEAHAAEGESKIDYDKLIRKEHPQYFDADDATWHVVVIVFR